MIWQERPKDGWDCDAPTKDVGGEEDDAAGAGNTSDVGPVASREVADDLAGLAAM